MLFINQHVSEWTVRDSMYLFVCVMNFVITIMANTIWFSGGMGDVMIYGWGNSCWTCRGMNVFDLICARNWRLLDSIWVYHLGLSWLERFVWLFKLFLLIITYVYVYSRPITQVIFRSVYRRQHIIRRMNQCVSETPRIILISANWHWINHSLNENKR